MVKFIVGKANCDISATMRGELVSLMKKSGKSEIVYVVPDQFEYETERGLYKVLEKNGLLQRSGEVRIITFTGLADDMLKISGESRTEADAVIKNIIMHKVLLEQKSSLKVLLRISLKQGFCEKMLQTASMFKTAGISARELEKRINAINDESISDMPFMKKLSETERLYTGFETEMSDYIDEPDIAGLAAKIIAKESFRLFENTDFFVDCFNDFTYNQIQILNELIRKSRNITFGFTTDINSESEVFFTANSNISHLKDQAVQNDIPVVMENGAVFRADPVSALGVLSENFFSGKKKCGSAGRNVELISASNIYEELDFAAAKIKRLASEDHIRYNSIAVLCTDLGNYKKYIENTFKKYDIPFFTDTRESIIHRPLINAVISLLNALSNFSVDTVLSCVKTGFFSKFSKKKNKRAGLSASDINVFENYIYEWALETNHLKKPFTFAAHSDVGGEMIEEEYDENGSCTEIDLSEDKRTVSERCRDEAEEIRESIVKPIWELSKKVSGRNSINSGSKITEMLYDFLINKVDISCAVHAKCRVRQKDGLTVLDREQVTLYQRLWDALISIFDKLYEELSDTDIAFSDYCRLFCDLCEGTTLAAPPQYMDSVLVGDIDRTRADNIKAAFILGASYDSFPTNSPQLGIFSEYDMELIRKNLFDTADSCGLKSIREQYNLSLYRAYKAVCLPTEYLCISCPDSDPSGEPLEPSGIITQIAVMFTDVKMQKASSFGDKFYCRSLKAVKMRCAFGINTPSRENALLKEVLIKNGEQDFVEMLDEIKNSHQSKPLNDEELYQATSTELKKDHSGKHNISPVIARLLFPTKLGASSVEKISECRFKFFCEYGLNIKDRIQRNFNSSKRGEAIHFIFEHLLKDYRNEIFKFDRTDFYNLSLMYLEKYFLSETNNDFSEDMRTDFLFRNTANTAADVLLAIQSELFPRGYVPKFFELDIDDSSNKKMIIIDEQKTDLEPPLPALYVSDNKKPVPPPPAPPRESGMYIYTAPFKLLLNNGTNMTIAGRIDRVDLMNFQNARYFRVVDYKSSVHCFDPQEAAKYGIHIQMLLYLFALYKANLDNPNFKLLPGGVSYLPSKNEGAADELLGAYRLIAMNYHESGLLIADDVTRKDYNAYVEYIKKRIAQSDPDFDTLNDKDKAARIAELENSILKSYDIENGCTDAADFNRLCRDVTAVIKTKLDTLYNGGVSAIPQVHFEKRFDINGKIKKSPYPADPCAFCKFSGICGNQNINVFKIKDEKDSNDND